MMQNLHFLKFVLKFVKLFELNFDSPLHFEVSSQISPLHLAVGSQILPLHHAAGSQIIPLQNGAGSERKNFH
jgi:hypothetical protein